MSSIFDTLFSGSWSLITFPWVWAGPNDSLIKVWEGKHRFIVENPGTHHHNQLTPPLITLDGVTPLRIPCKEEGTTHLQSDFPQNPLPQLSLEKTPDKPIWGTFCKIPDQCSSRASRSWKVKSVALSQIGRNQGDMMTSYMGSLNWYPGTEIAH